MPYIRVHIDLNDLDTSDLIEEIQQRELSISEQKELLNELEDLNLKESDYFPVKNLDDEIKVRHLSEMFKCLSVTEIENLLKVKNLSIC